MDVSENLSELLVIIAHKDQRHVFFKPKNYDIMVQMARSYFSIPRGQTLVVSVGPEAYPDARVIWFRLDENTSTSTSQHKVTDTIGPLIPVPSAAAAEEEVWRRIDWESWETVRDELIKTYEAPDMIFTVISNTSRRYRLRVHSTYSATVMRWLVACVEDWEGFKFKIITDHKREELSEEQNLTGHGLKQQRMHSPHLRIYPKVFGFRSAGEFGKGRYAGPFTHESDPLMVLKDFPIYP